MLPNFIFIGAEKGGTTWFYSRLKQHPDVFLPETKEIHFFNRFNSNLQEIDRYEKQGLGWYERFFRHWKGQKVIGEVTPMYLCDPAAPQRIRDVVPEARLICSLRNPVDRAYSHYWMARAKAHTHASFEEVVAQKEARFIERGLYGRQVARYLERFPREQLLVLIHEEVFADPLSHLKQVCTFLGIDPSVYDAQEGNAAQREHAATTFRSPGLHNTLARMTKWMRTTRGMSLLLDTAKSAGLARWLKDVNRKEEAYPPLSDASRAALFSYYQQDIAHLEELMQRKLDCWKA